MPLKDADEIVDAPPAEVLLDAMHVRDQGGRWSIAGAAWIKIAGEVPVLRPLAIAARLPAISKCIELIYAMVARNRHRISHLLGDRACAVASEPRRR
jgi:predicted DCC family thiol-disulfide oxidoreductase YuxK